MNKSRIQILFTIIVLIGFGVSSCDEGSTSADKLSEVPDQFVFEEETYELGWGSIIDWEDTQDNFHGVSFELYQQKDMYGESDSLKSAYSLWFYARTGGKDVTPEEGTYTFNQESVDAGFITNAYLIFWENGHFPSNTDEDIHVITSGELEITKKDEVYLLEFEMITEDNESITGSYSAELDTYKLSDFINEKRAFLELINRSE